MAAKTGSAGLARLAIAGGALCGVIGLAGGLTSHAWKLGPIGWFTGGGLLVLIAIALHLDAARGDR